jgi:hypothetical protein
MVVLAIVTDHREEVKLDLGNGIIMSISKYGIITLVIALCFRFVKVMFKLSIC